MPHKIPLADELLNMVKNTAAGAVKDPKGTSGRLLGQAKGAAGAGRQLAEGLAAQVLEQVNARTRHRRAADAPRAETHPVPSPAPIKAHGDPVAPHPATAAPSAEPVPSTESRLEARNVTPADVAKKTPATRATAKKAPTKKAPTKKAPTEMLATKVTENAEPTESPGDKLPPRAAAPTAPPPPPLDIETNPEATAPGSP